MTSMPTADYRVLAALVAVIIVALGAVYVRTARVCIADRRTLSQNELVARSIKDFWYRRPVLADLPTDRQDEIIRSYVSYTSVDEFRSKNSSCCSISDNGSEGRVTLASRLLGGPSYWFNAHVRVYYRDTPEILMFTVQQVSLPIDRCGLILARD